MTRSRTVPVAVALFLQVLSATALVAQNHAQYERADIEYGAAIYASQCSSCHGAAGDGISGINLRAGRFKRVNTDDDLRSTILAGVPGTGMPAFKFNPAEITGIVAFVRNMDAAAPGTIRVGNPARGKEVYDDAQCAGCHRINGKGSKKGPNLSDIGSLRPSGLLEQSLLDPTSRMTSSNRFIRAVTKTGRVITGRRVNEDSHTVQLIEESEERLTALDKSDLSEYTVAKTSPMPSYRDRLNDAQRSDLLAYLLTLRGIR
jgi:cytochrome c oxidase cbb3-type subunit III